jgi:hypothetical protein
MDALASRPVYDPLLRSYLRQKLGSDSDGMSAHDARQSLMKLTKNARPQALVAADFIFRFKLLDVFAEVLHAPHHPNFSIVPRSSMPPFNLSRMKTVRFISLLPHTFVVLTTYTS